MKSTIAQAVASLTPCPPRLMRERESARAYDPFKLYVKMGDNASIQDLSKICEFNVNSLEAWAEKFQWDERVNYP